MTLDLTLDYRQHKSDNTKPAEWPRVVSYRLDRLTPAITRRDLLLLEGAIAGRAALAYADRMRIADILRCARDSNQRVALDGQAAVLDAVRARVALVAAE